MVTDLFYFSQSVVLDRYTNSNCEIRYLRFSLYKEYKNKYPEYGICKILEINSFNEREAQVMKEQSHDGILKY